MRSLRLAFGLLTILPVGAVDADARTAGRAMLLAPLAGVAAALPGVVLLTLLDGPPLVLSALAVGSLAAMTGALHWDGLADAADGLATPAGRDRLAVMRRSDLGPVGAFTIAGTLLVQVAALSGPAAGGDAWKAWLLAVAVSRAALPAVCVRGTRIARPGGLGALVIGQVPPVGAVAVAGLVLLLGGLTVAPPVRAVLAGLIALSAAFTIRALAMRRLGGLTGDVLGAVVEITAATCLVALSLSF
jgi:adenosylcobinamide-GDP ribazoletransferase